MKIVEQLRAGALPGPDTLLDELAKVFPLLNSLVETPQDPEWHAEGDVRTHTLMVVDELYSLLNKEEYDLSIDQRVGLIIGAALHDIAKPLSTREQEIAGKVRVVSPRHAEQGQSYVAPLIGTCDLNENERSVVLGIIRHHHDPKKLVLRSQPKRKYVRLSRVIEPRLLYLFEQCDIKGRTCIDAQEQLEILELFKLELEYLNLWQDPSPYSEWRSLFAAEVSDPRQRQYVYSEAIRLFESGAIQSPEEALGKTYQNRQEYGVVTILCAPSASGKSTWVNENGSDAVIVSLDQIRKEIAGSYGNQSKNGQVLQLARERLKEGLRKKRDVIWDATTLRRDSRSIVSGLAHDYHAMSRIVSLGVAPEVVQRRNRKRENSVPAAVIEKQYKNWQWPDLWEAHQVELHFSGAKEHRK